MKQKINFDEEELEILKAVEKGNLKPVKNKNELVKKYSEYAKNTLKKEKRVNLRISAQDLEGLQHIAINAGLPYQTLITSVIHKYVTGQLVERNN